MKKNVVLSNEEKSFALIPLEVGFDIGSLIKKFFPSCSSRTGYSRLLALRHAGMIQVRSDGKRRSSFVLDRRGFDAIREDLPILKQDGYKSEKSVAVSSFRLFI